MKKNVVYILGAGFSAPLGIPVMRNFIDEARKIRRRDDAKYGYFSEVIDLVKQTISAEKYFQHDSGNIEEALSLLEMKSSIESDSPKDSLVKFIVDVIKASTPPVPESDLTNVPKPRWNHIFTTDRKWQGYCALVASLNHLEFVDEGSSILVKKGKPDVRYSILSLNYDMVLENACAFLNKFFVHESGESVAFRQTPDVVTDIVSPRLLKIHGSVDTGNIIPPTLHKGLYGKDLPIPWRNAYDILAQAHEIRVIGYSLPQTDSYIRYLLMASIDHLRDLDCIDWIVRDASGKVKERFEEFVRFKNKRFRKADSADYLSEVFGRAVNTQWDKSGPLNFDKLEQAHDAFMSLPS